MRQLLPLLLLTSACDSGPQAPPPANQVIGGVLVKGEMLRDGAKVFAVRCATCHGPQGDGNGPTGRAQNPKPRDFHLGIIKYASVRNGELAPDADYARIIHGGLKDTNMLALPLAPNETDAVIQYVKALSPKWTDPSAKAGVPVGLSPNPWDDAEAAVARGREIVRAQCISCHATADTEGTASESIYGWLKAPKLTPGLTLKAGSSPDDIYRTLAAGIGGTQMKALKDSMPEADLWALVHYIGNLCR